MIGLGVLGKVSEGILEKLTVAQLVTKFPAGFTRALHWTLYWATWIQSTTSYPIFFQIHFDIILPSTSRSSEWSLPFRFSDLNFVRMCNFPNACYMLRPCHHPWYHYHNNSSSWSV